MENRPYIIDLPGHSSESGNLSFWDNLELFPSGIQRCFWISKVKKGETRGNHAHQLESQVIISLVGILRVEVTTLVGEMLWFTLDSSSKGLFVPPLNWISISFSEDSILLGLCDRAFSEEDYIRDKKDFDNYQKRNK
ncbi:FdtA/QdtA family cupin domain-containing protein [Algoriphagus sp.]|uniref:sugar 3,4-ketoisomerase n=1 Tax=Algoriphagus sp. TaxID=1872435 RepID=UPI0025F09039|nr:FdtA/QdtA family cupin domain-containing protein [Algoriphagus sp.]